MITRITTLISCVLAFVFTSVAAGDEIFEPFTTSNLNPFTQIHGLPITRSANLVAPGSFNWHLQFDAANNFTSDDANTESIIIDGETHRSVVSMRYGINDDWEVGIDVPYVSHKGGSLDGFIENWHDFWGLPNGGREDAIDDLLQYTYQSNGVTRVNQTRSANGMGDVKLNFGYRLSGDNDRSRAWTLRGGVKLPTGDPDKLTGSDSTDVFLGLHLSDPGLFSRPSLYFHGSLGVIALGNSDVISERVEDWALYGSGAIAWSVSRRVSLKAQFDFHTAMYDSKLREIGDFTGQLVFGGSIRLTDKASLDISLAEDVITDTSPDVVFQLGFSLSL